MNIHFIAIGGSIMHNLAIALHRSGHTVSGSDDKIYGVSKQKLSTEGLMPSELGWRPELISSDLDLVILGMHAKLDNPELVKAQQLGLTIQSFPEYVANQCVNKKRVAVGGSHGKTTTTSMIMHILKSRDVDFDYLVGAQLDDFDLMVRLTDAPIIVIEGDEYLSSPLDRRPKFFHFNADISVLTGIAWDHANVFPTEEVYRSQFEQYLETIRPDATVFYDANDMALVDVIAQSQNENNVGYLGLSGSGNKINLEQNSYGMQVFGRHNRKNIHAAILVCDALGISYSDSLEALKSFKGAHMRQTLIRDSNPIVYRDFGHAPSKVRATIKAFTEKFPDKEISVVVELHTYSSMKDSFIDQYSGVFEQVAHAAVCYDEEAYRLKQVEPLSDNIILGAFKNSPTLIKKATDLTRYLKSLANVDVIVVLSSGNLLGIEVQYLFD